MGLFQRQLDKAFEQGGSATDAYENAKKRRQTTEEGQASRDAALSQLITGHQLADEAKNSMYDKQLQTAKDLRSQYGSEANIDAGDVRIGGIDPLTHLLKARELQKPQLTPGQTEAERTAAKKLADYEAAGGRSSAEQNLKQIGEVKSDLTAGKRDTWDRKVGGALSSFPSLMGAFAPSEKTRRDKVRATALMMAKQSDPNPTEKQINEIMGQLYDPSSDDRSNLSRLDDYENKARAQNAQMQQSAANLSKTGYSMPGIAGNPAAKGIPQEAPQTKTIGGTTYVKTPAGWVAQ
jgi:hypothetical protein